MLSHAKAPDGTPLVAGKAVTGFTNTAVEEAVGLAPVFPFLVEVELKRRGAYSDWLRSPSTPGPRG